MQKLLQQHTIQIATLQQQLAKIQKVIQLSKPSIRFDSLHSFSRFGHALTGVNCFFVEQGTQGNPGLQGVQGVQGVAGAVGPKG